MLDPRGWRGKWELTVSGLNLKHARRRSLWEGTCIREGDPRPSLGALSTLKGLEEADQARCGGDRVPVTRPREESKTSQQVPVSQKTHEGGRVPISAGQEEVTGDIGRTWVWCEQILDDNGGPCRKFHTEIKL